MVKAAGILFVVGETALFLRRGNGSACPNTWGCPGGKIEDGETEMEAAIRETMEEIGVKVKPEMLKPWCRTVTPGMAGMPAVEGDIPAEPAEVVDFCTYICRLKEQFTPKLNLAEHDGYAWSPIHGAPQPLHLGYQIALDRLSMDELGVARAIADGRLSSPQHYDNVDLFNIRITGTGASYRHALDEFVWRDPAIYLNEEFLARCNGLPVIWEHPDENVLDSEEFANRIVGTTFVPYIKGDEVWAVVKIYDNEAAELMRDERLSTSPAVKLSTSDDDRVTLEDNKTLLIEGKPFLLDHIAICERGVWDKGGEPEGVDSITVLADTDEELVYADSNEKRCGGISQENLIRARAAMLLANVRLCEASN